jgi:hypothetical protein
MMVLTIIMALLGVVVFVLTQDMAQPMVLVDWWTIINAVILIVEAIAVMLLFRKVEEEEELGLGERVREGA